MSGDTFLETKKTPEELPGGFYSARADKEHQKKKN
jgi:hypothetical protein